MNQRRVHNGCLTNKLVNIAKMSPKQASVLCEIAHSQLSPLQIASLPLPAVIRRFGAAAAAQTDMKNAASDTGGVPDKKYPISNYQNKQECIDKLSEIMDPRECSSIFGPATNTVGGKWWTSAGTNPVPVSVHSGRGNRIAVKKASIKNNSDRINAETREYYSKIGRNATRNASVSNTEVVTPSWIVVANIDTSHLRNATSSSNLRGAALDKHIEYMEAIHEDISTTLANRAERRDNQARLKNAKINSDSDKPAWAIVCNA
jgi:hypothetical protein